MKTLSNALVMLVSLAIVVSAGAAQEKTPPPAALVSPGYSLKGTIFFPEKGDVYIRVLTRLQFEKDETGDIRAILKIGPDGEKAGAVNFSFSDVPEGVYAVQVFQDTRKNGKLDSGTFGPKEPWGTYRHARPRFRAPKWDEMAFTLNKDMEEIRIDLK